MHANLRLAGLAALGASVLVQAQEQQAPLVDIDESVLGKKPLIDTEALQDLIKGDNLLDRAKELYKIAKLGEGEYNHPTRVIGSEGEFEVLGARMMTVMLTRDA